MSTATATPEVKSTSAKIAIDFGNGRYSALMTEVFDDAQKVLQVDEKTAEKIARQVSSDLGAIMSGAVVKVKVGSINKDGKITLSEAAKLKNVTMTDSLLILKALSYAAEAGKNGFLYARTQWKANEDLTKAIARFES